jgi:MYXO-CTERM domain-containing protein
MRAACALLALLSLPGSAHAYVRTRTSAGVPTHWPRSCVPLTVHLDELPGMPVDDMRAAVMAAAQTWSSSTVKCAGLSLPVEFEPGAGPPAGDDGVNVIGARSDGWCQPGGAVPPAGCHNPAAVAVTSSFSVIAKGEVLGGDIELNTINFTWGHFDAAAPDHQDLQAAIAHELGHVLGFDHPCWSGTGVVAVDDKGSAVPDCYNAPEEIQASILYPSRAPGDPPQRMLSAEDQRGLCAVYPAASAPDACPAPPHTGCNCAIGRAASGGLPVIGLGLFLLVAWRRRSFF